MTYHIKIFGCQMNYSDAERIATLLEKHKLKKAASLDEADFVIFVTCGVRQSAEDRVYGQINNIRKRYPAKYIILTGCLAHRKDVQRRLKGKVDLFCKIKDFPKEISSVIARSAATRQSRPIQANTGLPARNASHIEAGGLRYARNDKNDYLKIIPRHANAYAAYVPIMTGCNNFCSYCVVPHARGRKYSRPAEDILKEISSLVKKGCKEIILLGQNVNSYKSSLSPQSPQFPQINFPKLLQLIEKIPGNFWLTFLTSHPKDMSDELIKTIARSKKICEYISLPVQSGDNKVLKKMNRHYTAEHYKNLIKKIRQAFVEVGPQSAAVGGPTSTTSNLPPAISTDIIVGFPGETKKQFENTAKLLRELKFDMAYISQYSPRPETAAWKMRDNVSKSEKVRREKVSTKILEKTALANNKKYIEKTVEVLIDKIIPNPPDSPILPKKYFSHTRTQKKVIFFSNKKISVGNFAKVKITKAKAFGLEGKGKI